MTSESHYSVVTTPRAEAELDAVVEYISDHSPDNALMVFFEIRSCIDSLAEMPRRFPRAPEVAGVGREFRYTVVCGYRLVYSIVESPRMVVIHSIRHAARLPAADLTTPE